MKNIKSKSLIVLLITIGMLFLILKDDFTNIIDILKSVNLSWIIIAIIVSFIGTLIQSISFKLIINQQKKDFSLLKTFRLNIITNFFNGITPLASGGHPFQIYELHKERIKVADSTSVVIENFLVYQISLMFLSIVCLVANYIFGFVNFNTTLSVLFYLGFLLNLLILILLYILGSSKNIGKIIAIFLAKILAKFKIIKNKERVINKLETVSEEFYNGFKEMKRNRKIILAGILIQIVGISIYFASTIFVFKALNLNINMTIVECAVASLFAFIAGSIVPIPGGTGGMEYSFFGFFTTFTSGAPLKSALLLWRFITFIFPVVFGGMLFNIRKDN